MSPFSGHFLMILPHVVCSREFSTKRVVAINASKSVISSMSLPNVPCKSNICPHGLVTIWAGKDISNLWVYINFICKETIDDKQKIDDIIERFREFGTDMMRTLCAMIRTV